MEKNLNNSASSEEEAVEIIDGNEIIKLVGNIGALRFAGEKLWYPVYGKNLLSKNGDENLENLRAKMEGYGGMPWEELETMIVGIAKATAIMEVNKLLNTKEEK